jgi:hypothetical protein
MSDLPFILAPGQRWQYLTRSGEEASRLTILRLEDWHGEAIVHVALDGLAMKNPLSREGYSTSLGHTPVSEAALRRCLTVLDAESTDLPDYQSGYNNWKAAADTGEGGHFTTSLAEIVDGLEQALNTIQPEPEPNLFRKVNPGLLSAGASSR